MAKQQILLVDADSSSARLLEVSLRSAGFTVATADSAESAIAKLEHGTPDLIITDTRLPGADGFAFVRQLRARPEGAAVPVVFLTEQGALEDKLRGLELGVDDYLAKPIFVREVVTRVHLLLARKKQQRIAAEPLARTRFSGSLEDVAVVDLMQTVAVSGKSGVASVRRGERQAWIYFDKGQVIDAEVGDLRGEEAVYRTITWTTGVFDVEFRAIERERVIEVSHNGLLMEGMRRVDELNRLAEQLPPETSIIDIDHDALATRLNEIPDELNGILRLIDGKRTLLDLIDASPFDDLSTLTVLSKFYFEGLLSSTNLDPVEWAPGSNRVLESSPPPANEPSQPPSEAVATQPPPTRSPLTAPPSTLPTIVEPPEDARRQTPVPSLMARPTVPAPIEGKLTPKGIVNVGEHSPSAPKVAAKPAPLPSPFRAANDTPRRSPIPMPMPRGNAQANGAAHGNGVHANGRRESRTSLGLSAVGLHPLPVAAKPVQPEPPQPKPATAAPVVAPPAPVAREVTREAPARQARASDAVASETSRETAPGAPSSHPESEQEFFEAGDEGTYAGGPRSGVPEPHPEPVAPAPAPAPRPRRAAAPALRVKSRRSTVIVAGILVVAAVPLVVGLWRQLTAASPEEASPIVTSEPVVLAQPADAPQPAAATPTNEPVPTGSDAPAPHAEAAEPTPPSGAEATPAPEAAAAVVTEPPPSAAAQAAAPSAAPTHAAAPAPAKPVIVAAPRPRATRAPVTPVAPAAPPNRAPAAAPAPSASAAALPPAGPAKGLNVPMPPMVPKGPKEKPPTAAYPVQ